MHRTLGLLCAGVLMIPLATSVPAFGSADPATTTASWNMAGHDITNDRSQPAEHTITRANVHNLQLAWSRSFTGVASATPTVAGGVVYLPDSSGMLWALKASTGSVVWSHAIADYTGLLGDYSRTSPAYNNGRLFLGDHDGAVAAPNGAHILSVNASTGALLWDTVVDSDPSAIITGSPSYDRNTIYVGVSSNEEEKPSCCHFRGSVVALDANTGQIKWRTMTAPKGYTGNAVWSSAPVVDHTTGLLYVGTGNNYTVPAGVCTAPQQTGCKPHAANDYVDSLLALHLSTGRPARVLDTISDDVSSHVCSSPDTCGPDWDFGSDPNEFTATIGGQQRRLVGIGQKSGVYWAVDAGTGALVWQTQVGPGGRGGGIQWGSATDGQHIYVDIANSDHVSWRTAGGTTTTGGAFAALDPADGHIVWQVADPHGAQDLGFVSVANGIVYAGSNYGAGNNMYAINSATGHILWSHSSGGPVVAGAAIVNGTVYWPFGYRSPTCPPTQPHCGAANGIDVFRLP